MSNTPTRSPDSAAIESCDVCIVGAGIAGLNALHAASCHLPAGSKVILIDRKPRPGGMWNNTYNYVRLHQPHRLFTAGDLAWKKNNPAGYLADRNEVLDHLDDCINLAKQKLQITEYYACDYLSHEEVSLDGGSTYAAQVTCRAVDDPERLISIKADRLIKAFGFNVQPNPPLQFSSATVRSISPDSFDLLGEEMRKSDKPVFIVGGGKTAMDTAHTLLTHFPEKKITLLIGKGTVFIARDVTFPAGLARWYGGTTSIEAFLDLGLRFTGDNESEVLHHLSTHYGTQLDARCQQFVFGILSRAENAFIKSGVDEVVMDYLDDIEDRDGAAVLRLRRGEARSIDPQSWIINCSGYVLRHAQPYEPFISTHGTTISIQETSAVHFLTTFGAYFLSHLFFLDKLKDLPLYELDILSLSDKNKQVLPFAAVVHVLYNVSVITNNAPAKILLDCGLDFDRWYPLHKRMLAAYRLRKDGAKKTAHYRRALDRVHERFAIRCGELSR